MSDWGRPAGSALRRISDGRAAQFWDKDHLFAKKLAADLEAKSAQPKPQCCTANGLLWDVVLVYGQDARWDGSLPAPLLIEGPVVDTPRRIAGLLVGP